MFHLGKVENGAQLLARLGPRVCVRGVASALGGLEHRPGSIIELYGGEGVGKTELLLYLTSSVVCPPASEQCCRLHCAERSSPSHASLAQVLWLDCDYKFPVLRLAVLFEQRVLSAPQTQSQKNCNSCVTNTARNDVADQMKRPGSDAIKVSHASADPMVKADSVCSSSVRHKRKAEEVDCYDPMLPSQAAKERKLAIHKMSNCEIDKRRNCEINNCEIDKRGKVDNRMLSIINSLDDRDDGCTNVQIQPNHVVYSSSASGHKKVDCSAPGHVKGDFDNLAPGHVKVDCLASGHRKVDNCMAEPCVHTHKMGTEGDEDSHHTETEALHQLSEEDVEKRVKECLESVQVMQCSSSQQLISTLYSLESFIACNPNIALLIIDPISAFAWSDRCLDLSSNHLHKNMTLIASILTKIASSYGILVVVTKQALVKAKAKTRGVKPSALGTASSAKSSSSSSSSSHASSGSVLDCHVEFLGKAWTQAVTHRYILNKSPVCHNGVKMMRYTMTGVSDSRHFTISDSGLCLE